MLRYDWKNLETGEIVEHDHHADPPDLPGEWERVYSLFGIKVNGGNSPSSTSVDKKSQRHLKKGGKRATSG